MQSITIHRPDDWHVHFRDGNTLKDTVKATASTFKRALVMPNLVPPLTTFEAIKAYQARIEPYIVNGFKPYFTLYLTETITDDDTLEAAQKAPDILGAKLYPMGATTHSAAGVRSFKKLYPVLEAMQAKDLVVQVHGEATNSDIFKREKIFIEDVLKPIVNNFPKLRMVLEHISTSAAVDFVTESSPYIAATITPHHLLYNRNHLLSGGIKPHFYCLPILKSEKHQRAVQKAALSGNPKFFLGTDSAPHAKGDKENACGCAGIYSAPYALCLYAEFFAKHQALNKLNDFASTFGALFYQLPCNQQQITLIQKKQTIPETLSLGNDKVVPIAANTEIEWSIYES